MKKFYLLTLMIGISSLIFGQVYFSEDFSDGDMPPTDWTIENQTDLWAINNGNACGGEAPEAWLTWVDEMGDTRLISPEIDLTGSSDVIFYMKHFLDDYSGSGYTISIETRSGDGDWNVLWEESPSGSIGPEELYVPIDNADAGAEDFQFSFYVDGNLYNYDAWLMDDITVLTLADIELELSSINTSMYYTPGEVSIPFTITNFGSDDITSFEAVYTIDGGAESATFYAFDESIPLGASADFTHTSPYNFTADGVYTIELTISNVNGVGDVDPDNNVLTKELIVNSNFVQRKILIENFTTGSCPNCPPIHVLLEDYVAEEPNSILIAQHAGYYTDEMTIPENTELLALYNDGGSTYAPAQCIDRFYYTEGLVSTPDPGPVFWPGESSANTITRMDDKVNEPAFVTVNINGNYNSADGSLALTISGELIADVAGDDLRLVVYLIEDGLVYPQSNGGNDYIHNNVMRDAVSGTWGDADIITENTGGTTFSESYEYTLDDDWDANNMAVVAFVANYDTDVNDRAVLNAEEVAVTALVSTSIGNNLNTNNVAIYPNPSTGQFYINGAQNSTIKVYSITGTEVASFENFSANQIDLSKLDTGIYFINVTMEDNTIVNEKVSIQK